MILYSEIEKYFEILSVADNTRKNNGSRKKRSYILYITTLQ